MKKIITFIFTLVISFSFFPSVSIAAIVKLNNLTNNTQFLATTTGSTSMHMNIIESGTDTHKFQWDLTPWRVDQGGTGKSSFSDGSVLFYSNGFSENNANFFWDFINNALSIGTNSTSTLSKLTVKGSLGQTLLNILSTSGAPKFFIGENGNIGINTNSPQYALDVSGSMYSRLVNTNSSIDWSAGNVQSVTLTSNQTLSFANGQAGGEYKLIINQDTTGGRTVVWPANVKWPSGNMPILTTTAEGIDVISFLFDGSNYLGSYNLNYLATSAPSMISFDNASNVGTILNANGSSGSFSYTTGNCSNRLMVVGLETADNEPNVNGSSVVYNGSNLTYISGSRVSVPSRVIELWYMVAPSIGTHNLSVTLTGTPDSWTDVFVATYCGVKQTGQPDSNATNITTGPNPITATTTTIADNTWLVGLGGLHGNVVNSNGSNTTIRISGSQDGTPFVDSNSAQTPPGDHSITLTDTGDYHIMTIASFAPAP